MNRGRDDIRISKRLSLVLRHEPGSVGSELDHEGWVDVSMLLAALAAHGTAVSRTDLARVVEESDKQWFEWDVEADRIRARQGHSVEVDLGLEPAVPPVVLSTVRRSATSTRSCAAGSSAVGAITSTCQPTRRRRTGSAHVAVSTSCCGSRQRP